MKGTIKAGLVKSGIAALVFYALTSEAALTINVGDSLTVTSGGVGDLLPAGSYQIGYVNEGNSATPNENVYAGAFHISVTDSTTHTSGTLISFCTDVGVNWRFGPVAYQATTFGSINGVNPAWSAVPQSIQNASWIYNQLFVPNAGSLSADQLAGIQLAIWKVLYDTTSGGGLDSFGNSFTAGRFQANGFGGGIGDAISDINSLLTARSGSGFPLYNDTWLGPVNKDSQGLLYNASTPNGNALPAVPEPATVLAGILLLLPFGASAFRIVRKRKMATL